MSQPRRKKGVDQAPEDQNPAPKPEDKKKAELEAGRDKLKTEAKAALQGVNPIVADLARALAITSSASYQDAIIVGGAGAEPTVYAESSDVGEVVSFEGYLGATVPHPPGASADDMTNLWSVFYLDWDLRSWLIIQRSGIVRHLRIEDPGTHEDAHDVIWVRADARIASGRGSASVESLFLQGQFTSAGDFEAEAAGGGASPATGRFCGRSPWCCGGKTVCGSKTK